MLTHRLRRWPNIASALGQYLVFAGNDGKNVDLSCGAGERLRVVAN